MEKCTKNHKLHNVGPKNPTKIFALPTFHIILQSYNFLQNRFPLKEAGGENQKKQGEEKVEGQCDFYVY